MNDPGGLTPLETVTTPGATNAGVARRSNLPRIEFRKSQRKDLTFYLAAVSASVLSWVVWLLPSFLTTWLARRIGDLSYLISKNWRANVQSNLSHVLDLPPDSDQIRSKTRRIFQTHVLNLLTLLETPHQSRDVILKSLQVARNGWSSFDAWFQRGNGVIVLTAHLGAFDFVGNSIQLKGYPLTVLTARTTNRFAFDFVTFLRSAHDMRLIEASSSGVREIISVLEQGECIGLASDRDFFLSGRPVTFFGETTSLPVGAARLARDTGAAIIPMFTIRGSNGHQLLIEQGFTVPKTSDKHADLELGMALVTRALERAIAVAPDQWVMFQRVWPEDYYLSE